MTELSCNIFKLSDICSEITELLSFSEKYPRTYYYIIREIELLINRRKAISTSM